MSLVLTCGLSIIGYESGGEKWSYYATGMKHHTVKIPNLEVTSVSSSRYLKTFEILKSSREINERDFKVLKESPVISGPVASGIKSQLFAPHHHTEPLRFLIQGGLHGDEMSTPRVVRWLKSRYLKRESALNKLDSLGIAIDFLPKANPTGAERLTRLNSRGVNLNRNFPVLWGLTSEFPGTHPLSEVETQSISRLVEYRRYVAAVDIHGYVPWLVAPSPPEVIRRLKTPGINDESQFLTPSRLRLYELWTKTLKKEAKALGSDYTFHTAGELGDGGAFEDWAFWKMGVLAYCLEMREPLDQDKELALKSSEHFVDQFSADDEKALQAYEASVARMFKQAYDLKKLDLNTKSPNLRAKVD